MPPFGLEGLESSHHVSIFFTGMALLLLQLFAFLRWASTTRCRAAWASFVAWARSLVPSRCRRGRKTPEGDALRPHVARLVRERQLLRARKYLFYGNIFMNLMMAAILVNIVTWTNRWITWELDKRFVIAFSVNTILTLFPSILKESTLPFWYSVFMAIVLSAVMPSTVGKEMIPVLSEGMMCFRLLFGMFCLNMPLVLLWNGAYLLMVTYSYTYTPAVACDWMPAATTFALCELTIYFLLWATLQSAKNSMKAEVRQELEAMMSSNHKTAVSALLNTMSDAVVELDTDGRILVDSPKLACMLLHGKGRSLKGIIFDDLMASDEDRQRVADRVRGPMTQEKSMADVFHVNMRDSINNRFNVEMFHVCFRGLGDSTHHLIGLREASESTTRIPEPEDIMPEMRDIRGLHKAPSTCAGQAAPSCGSEVSEDPSPEKTSSKPDELKILFDACTFHVFDSSAAFKELCGVESNLLNILVSAEGSSFMKEFNDLVNQFFGGEADFQDCGRLSHSFKMRVFSGSGETVMKSYCSLKLDRHWSDADDSAQACVITAEIVLLDLKQVPRSSSRRLSRRRARSVGGQSSCSSSSSSGCSTGSLDQSFYVNAQNFESGDLSDLKSIVPL